MKTIWFMGDEYMSTGKTVTMYGGEFIKATRISDGKEALVATEKQRNRDAENQRKEWRAEQDGFNRLHKAR